MSDCDQSCDGCPNKAEHHLCDACCHDEVDAINRENEELKEKLEWQAACTKALMESQERLIGYIVAVERLIPRTDYVADKTLAENVIVVLQRAYHRGAEAMREAAASCVGSDTALLQTYRSVLEGRIRDLPIPKDNS